MAVGPRKWSTSRWSVESHIFITHVMLACMQNVLC
jgi:hypothetical protein